MALAKILFFLFLPYHLFFLKADSKCPESFPCGRLGNLTFPFTTDPECGLALVTECESGSPKIPLISEGPRHSWYEVRNINVSTNKVIVHDPTLQNHLDEQSCRLFNRNLSLPHFPFISFTLTSPNLTFITCPPDKDIIQLYNFQNYSRVECSNCLPNPPVTAYFRNPTTDIHPTDESNIPTECSVIQLPKKPHLNSSEWFSLLSAEFAMEWSVSEACSECHRKGQQCLTNHTSQIYCREEKCPLVPEKSPLVPEKSPSEPEKTPVKLISTIAISGGGLLLLLLCLSISYIVWLRKKKINGGYLLSRNMSSNPSKSDIECGSLYFGIPIFSYAELEEASNNFDTSRELGDGGFGIVYYGKLRDGRAVAIKRLYEHNYRRVEQFLNEIKILTGVRHPNLVSLYGCTSRRSRELLLVYEYISNGTVADHLHGERAKEALLTWPIRMKIAIETAAALAYLHKSDIIHRDVKTNNILLDNNFSVKVADFGLSKLFPNDVTHISTAPQGTPGYVDPDYYECYQLTDKSDVYSFGVVLIELISSMPAVDINRHTHQINLADLAVNRIQTRAFDELIDPSLGKDSDPEVTRMTNSVAELAFRCLQLEKDMRPCMEEVLAFLKDIQGGEDCNSEQNFEFSPHPLL